MTDFKKKKGQDQCWSLKDREDSPSDYLEMLSPWAEDEKQDEWVNLVTG